MSENDRCVSDSSGPFLSANSPLLSHYVITYFWPFTDFALNIFFYDTEMKGKKIRLLYRVVQSVLKISSGLDFLERTELYMSLLHL